MTDDAERRRRMRNRIGWALVVLGSVALIGGSLIVFYDSAFDTVDQSTTAEVLTPQQLDLLVEDYARVRSLELLAPPATRHRDAGVVLGPYVGVRGTTLSYGDLTPPFATAFEGEERGTLWRDEPAAVAELDPDFWPQLSGFDHLDLRGHGAWGRFLREGGAEVGPESAEPFLTPLVSAAKVHWAAALTGAVPLERALADTRELARLLASGGTWQGISAASLVLRLEHQALRAAVALPGADRLESLPPEVAEAPQRALAGTHMVLTGRAPKDSLAALQEAGAVASGLACAAVPGALELDWVRRSILHPPTVFEPDHAELFDAARRLAVDCGMQTLAAEIDRRPPLSVLEVKAMRYPIASGPASTPVLRAIALRVMLLGGGGAPKNPYRDE